jgi:GntR family transcriptional repressor for pyruvate dehydrogenase complex
MPQRTQNLPEAIAEQLLEMIRSEGLLVGAQLPSERELQERLGVGRSTVREAVRGLAALGVLQVRHGHGVFVATDPALVGATDRIAAALTQGVTRILLEARRPVETEIARLASLRRTSTDLKELRSVLARHDRALAARRPAAQPSAQFHVALSDAAHNDVLAGFVASYRRLLAERGPSLEHVAGYREWELAGHKAIFDAVQDRTPDLAAARMRSHLDDVVGYYNRLGWPL